MVIYRHKDKHSIREMCRFFKHQEKCRKTYGYIYGLKKGVYRNPKTVLQIMQKYGLLSVIRRKKYRNYGEYLHKYPNLLNRDFNTKKTNQK